MRGYNTMSVGDDIFALNTGNEDEHSHHSHTLNTDPMTNLEFAKIKPHNARREYEEALRKARESVLPGFRLTEEPF